MGEVWEIFVILATMKNLALTIALLLSFECLLAQHWEPFVPGETHLFQSDTSLFPDRSVRIDSVRGNFADSLWYFNRLLVPVPNTGSAYKNQPMFCQRTARVHPGGLFQLFDPGNIAIYTLADSGTSWLLDSMQMRMGTVTRVYEDSVFGTLDSLKVILVDGLDSLLLSKSYGLLSWPALLGPQHYAKVGIQERHVGDTLPGFAGFFPYKAGDVYFWHSEYHHQDNPGSDHDDYTWKMVVDSTTRSADRLDVYWSGIMMGGALIGGIWTIKDSTGCFLRRSHDEAVEISMSRLLAPYAMPEGYAYMQYSLAYPPFNLSNPPELWSSVRLHSSNDSITMTLGNQLSYGGPINPVFVPAGGDSLGPAWDILNQDLQIQEGLGLVFSGWWDFETLAFLRLVGHVIDGDTVGTIWPDSVLLHAALEPETGLRLWPNPLHDFLKVQVSDAQSYEVEILDLSGKTMLAQPMDVEADRLDLRALPAGIYLARISVNGRMQTRRVMVAR